MNYEAVIGLEVHAQLRTQTKLFCGCRAEFGAEPNQNVCPTCLGLPGALPTLNAAAVRLAVRAGLALGCAVAERSVFARKNYFYPDLPKGYQISQFDQPIAGAGFLDVDVEGACRRIRITRVHMEEDAGKSSHGQGGDSLVDLNRAGVPLIEIVSEPDLRSSAEAAVYMKTLRDILVFIGVNDGNLEQGSLRCDANVSLRPHGQETLGTRAELKNLNSFRFLAKAIDVEIARQAALLDAGERVVQETRSYDPDRNVTRTLRSKEDAHDYRYFADPDLPPLCLTPETVEAERAQVGELPRARRLRYEGQLGLSPQAALIITQHPATVRLFEETYALVDDPVLVANWVSTEVLKNATLHGIEAQFTVTATQLSGLLALLKKGSISGKQAKEVFALLENSDSLAEDVVAARGMSVVADDATLRPLCENAVQQFPTEAQQYRDGKKGLLGFFVGRVLKETGGKGDPKRVSAILTELLEQG